MNLQSSRRRRTRNKLVLGHSWIFLLNKLIKFAFFALIAGVIAVPILFLWYSRDLPTPGQLVTSKYKDATKIYDRKGVLLYSVFQDENRTYVKLDQIPKQLQEATISIEDKQFYQNNGFSVTGMLRALRNMVLLRGVQSGSTITQQLVKNVLLTNQQSLSRKVKELILAIQVDKKYSKDQILEMYLNNIPYGGTAIGVEAASEQYFGKKSNELDLAQSAFLAGLPQSPTAYSPFSGKKYYLDRLQEVLGQMVANNYITKEQSASAYKEIESYQFSQHDSSIRAPHFVMYVRDLLAKQFGEQMLNSGGLQVTTSLDYDIEKKAEDTVKTEVAGLKTYKVSNGAAVVTNSKTGEILAMVGSEDYFDKANDGNYNVATSNVPGRQPGSSLKPIIYATAFQKGYTPATMVMDALTNIKSKDSDPDYKPVNYDGKFHGPVQLRYALANSLNIPAVKVLAKVGLKDAMQEGYQMGITNWEPTVDTMAHVGLSLVLGGRETDLLDETTAYGVFANGGIRQDPVAVLKVTDGQGNTLYEYKKIDGKRVLSEEVSFLISHILSDPAARAMEFGTHSWLDIGGHTVAVKTGTTDEKRDNWTIGYTPEYVVGVWVGNNDNSPMNPVISSGITGASPIWNKIMTAVLKGKPNDDWLSKPPSNIVSLQVDSMFGGLPHGGQPVRAEYFVKGTQPTTESQVYKSKDGKDYYVIKEDDPVSTDGKNRWQEGIQAWIQQNHKDDQVWNPPSELLNLPPTPTADPSAPTATPAPAATATPTTTPAP